MLSCKEAIERLQAAASLAVKPQELALAEAGGRVLAADLSSAIDVPPADNSAMDGYAVRHTDWPGEGAWLSISQRIAAGSAPVPLQAGTAARIFTGAEIPDGADTVVMQEHCQEQGGRVQINTLPGAGANVRPRGQDIGCGQPIIKAGQRLRPQDLGLLASAGVARVKVYRRLRVAVISNGDELREPGQPLGPGQIYNSNRYLLHGLFSQWGFETVDLGIAPDRPEAISRLFVEAARNADVLVSTGGVSVGEEDHIKAVVESQGALDLWKVAIKPGKPMAFGNVHGTPFLGLPGNPASVLVTALILTRPFLFACQGNAAAQVLPVPSKARFDYRGSAREQYLRARRTAAGLELYPNQSSGVLLSASWGDGLVMQRPHEDIIAGQDADFLPYALLG